MRVVVIEPPQLAVSLDDVKRHLRLAEFDGDGAVLPSDEDPYLTGLALAAQMHIDGPEGWLGRSVGIQTLELRMDAWPGCLPFRPVIDVVSVTVDDVAIEGVTAEFDGVLNMPMGLPRPARELLIRYRAGYARWEGEGEARKLVPNAPAPIRHALLLLIGHWYANRETVNVGNIVNTMPHAFDALLSPYRIWA